MKLNKILNIKYPIIQGGMANISDGKFAAAISNCGGLGIIGSGGMTPEVLSREIDICKSLTDKPFGVNIMLLNPYCDDFIDIIIDKKVDLVSTGAGNPAKYIEKLHSENILVFPVISNSTIGERMTKYKVDGLIAEGMEAGGHIGEMTTMTLVKEIRDKVDIPIVAAGGIASGSQILAAEALGADGVQIGTLFLLSEECPIHINYKKKLQETKANNIIVIGKIAGIPIRLVKNKMSKEYIKCEREGKDKMELEKFTLGALKNAVNNGDMENGSIMTGLVASNLKEIKTLEEIFSDLKDEYENCLERLINGN